MSVKTVEEDYPRSSQSLDRGRLKVQGTSKRCVCWLARHWCHKTEAGIRWWQ